MKYPFDKTVLACKLYFYNDDIKYEVKFLPFILSFYCTASECQQREAQNSSVD